MSIYSRAVNSELPLDEVLGSYFPWCAMWQDELRALFAQYVETKQRHHVLDYDDLLLYWAHMMLEPSIAGEISERFDHVLVDEYQDTNKLQASVLLALRPNGKGMTVVGDDAQSIYSFRAATVRNILDFPGHFSPRAEIVTLEQNYRSTQPILAAANAVIELAEERFTKNLWSERKSAERPQLVSVRDEADQARYVVEKVLESREQGLALKAQSVLFRASHHSGQLEVELTRRNIPFVKFGGLKFLGSRAHQGRAGVPALGGKSARPRRRLPRHPIASRAPGLRRRRGCWIASPSAPIRRKPLATSSRRRRRPSIGRLSSKRFVWSAAARRAGPPSSIWCAAGTSRTSIASTTMRCCARPIFCNSSRSPRPIRAASGS